MTNIILCGGVGSRFWPLSRTRLPKQFARILPGPSLFEHTVKRNRALGMDLLVASNKDQHFLASNQLRALGVERFSAVIEPEGRNTAPAIALACLSLPRDELVLVSPSDHLIPNEAVYAVVVERAVAHASAGKLVTFGIEPTYAETGFGYIEADGEHVLSFKEKPDAATAAAYLSSGRHFWNSGMFCFRAGAFLDELATLAPEVHAASRAAFDHAPGRDPLRVGLEAMRAIPSISIDYAVMEKSAKVACVACPAELGWSDMGSFDAVYDHLRKDGNGSAVKADEPPVLVDCAGNLVLASTRQVALVGVDDLIVVDSPDAVLVAKRGGSQKVKRVYDELKARKSPLVDSFPRVERSWGNCLLLQKADDCVVKRIEVAPGQRLSLHRHLHREEHWTIVRGEAVVRIDDSRRQFRAGDSVLIPRFALHRLENPGTELLVLVETQTGTYLGEDDIERRADDGDEGNPE